MMQPTAYEMAVLEAPQANRVVPGEKTGRIPDKIFIALIGENL